MDSLPLVTITGISGYVGSQTCLYFLDDGGFRVRGTVRSKTNEAKIAPLKLAFGELFDQLELVEADLLDEQSIINACEGATYVIHTASPFTMEKPKHEDELIKPAVEGTMAALKGCQKHKVKRLVITSSIVAIMGSKDKTKCHFTVEDWADLDVIGAYEKSKTLAERAAWDFQKALPEDEKFDIVTINPGFVLGPSLVKCRFASGDFIEQVMMGKIPGMPKVSIGIVDVRDVAKAHLNAVKDDSAVNKRYMLVAESRWFASLGQDLDEVYGKKGSNKYKVTSKELPKMLCQFASCFDKGLASMMPFWGSKRSYTNDDTKTLLGGDFIPIKQSVQEMAVTLIDLGYIPDKR